MSVPCCLSAARRAGETQGRTELASPGTPSETGDRPRGPPPGPAAGWFVLLLGAGLRPALGKRRRHFPLLRGWSCPSTPPLPPCPEEPLCPAVRCRSMTVGMQIPLKNC